MILLNSMPAVHKGRHQLSPYLMPVRYLKTVRSMPSDEQLSGFAAGGATTDEKSYHISGNSTKDCVQTCGRTDNVPKPLADARKSSKRRIQPGSNCSRYQLKKVPSGGLHSWNKHCIPAPTGRNANLVASPRPPSDVNKTNYYTNHVEKGDKTIYAKRYKKELLGEQRRGPRYKSQVTGSRSD